MLLRLGLKYAFALLAVAHLVACKNVTFQADVEALGELRQLVLASGMQLSGWLEGDSDPCGKPRCGINDFNVNCNWEGLACLAISDEAPDVARVVGIEIKGQIGGPRLEGQLPTSLPPKLKSLSLPGNQMRGTLTDTTCQLDGCHDRWDSLPSLEIINLGGNNITGALPTWKELRNLRILLLQENQLTGYLPDAWVEKENLVELDVSDNDLVGDLPSRWGGFASLNKLKLAGNMFKNSIPDKWFNMKELQLLDVTRNCALCGTVPEAEDIEFRLLADGTNLNNPCSNCDGCECSGRSLTVIITHALISVAVFAGLAILFVSYRCLSRQCSDERDLEAQSNSTPPMEAEKVEAPTLIVNPDNEICVAKIIAEDVISDDSSIHYSSSEVESSTEEEEEDPSQYVVDNPHVLKFINKGHAPSNYHSWPEERESDTELVSYESTSSHSDSDDGYGTDLENHTNAGGHMMSRRRHRMISNMPDKFPEPPSGPPGSFTQARAGPSHARGHMATADSAPAGWVRPHHHRSHSDIPDTFPEPPTGPPERSAASSDFMRPQRPPVRRTSSARQGRRGGAPEKRRRSSRGQAGPSRRSTSGPDSHPKVGTISPRESMLTEWPNAPPARRMPMGPSAPPLSPRDVRSPPRRRLPSYGDKGKSRVTSADYSSLSPRDQPIPRILEESLEPRNRGSKRRTD